MIERIADWVECRSERGEWATIVIVGVLIGITVGYFVGAIIVWSGT